VILRHAVVTTQWSGSLLMSYCSSGLKNSHYKKNTTQFYHCISFQMTIITKILQYLPICCNTVLSLYFLSDGNTYQNITILTNMLQHSFIIVFPIRWQYLLKYYNTYQICCNTVLSLYFLSDGNTYQNITILTKMMQHNIIIILLRNIF
jgi:hypothetical protein